MTIPISNRFWILVVPLIPSILVSIFVLYHMLINRALRTAVNNHVIILLLFCGLMLELTDVIWYIYFFRNATVLSSTPAFCLAWTFFCSIGFGTSYILMAWASIERHILVFYPNWFATKRKRFVLHYIPLAICTLYPTIFYSVWLFIIPCGITFTYHRRFCGAYSCVTNISWVSLWDSIGHYILPAFITVIFSVALFVRVLYHRYRIRGRIDWRNYRKMAAQLLPISMLYILLQLPPMTMYAAYSGGLPWTVASSYYSDTLFFSYWVILLTPFASVISLPDLGTKCRNLFLFWRKRNAIQPEMTQTARQNAGQTIAVVPVVA